MKKYTMRDFEEFELFYGVSVRGAVLVKGAALASGAVSVRGAVSQKFPRHS